MNLSRTHADAATWAAGDAADLRWRHGRQRGKYCNTGNFAWRYHPSISIVPCRPGRRLPPLPTQLSTPPGRARPRRARFGGSTPRSASRAGARRPDSPRHQTERRIGALHHHRVAVHRIVRLPRVAPPVLRFPESSATCAMQVVAVNDWPVSTTPLRQRFSRLSRGLHGSPIVRGGYPFTDPAVSPCTMYFWKNSTSRTAGKAPRKPEAAITE
jgi:hypothetical protein